MTLIDMLRPEQRQQLRQLRYRIRAVTPRSAPVPPRIRLFQPPVSQTLKVVSTGLSTLADWCAVDHALILTLRRAWGTFDPCEIDGGVHGDGDRNGGVVLMAILRYGPGVCGVAP